MIQYSNICEYVCDNRYSIIINVFSTVIGAFLGFLFALIIYWIGNLNARKKLKNAKDEKAYNTLKRFSILLKTLVKSCNRQNQEFNNYATNLRNNPLDDHTPGFLATNDRTRLVDSDTLELYHSYINMEKSNNNKFTDYRNIFIQADFIQKFYDDLFIQNEKQKKYTFSDLKVIRDNLLAISVKIGLLQKDIQMNKPKTYTDDREFQFLEVYRAIFIRLKRDGFTKLEPYYNEFLIPFQSEIFDYLSDQNQADQISTHIATVMTRIDHIKLNILEHAKGFSDLESNPNISSAIEYLDRIRLQIEKNNKP
ncbi:MAG: hypothetical protein PF541_12435 [Prolixibacteraceae bacterium]|jgi:hypothetical protein|nr:hypothetical protein [Prolixibacteraceae bacterium]